MADPKELRERAEKFRQVARRRSPAGKVRSNAYLLALADLYEHEAEIAEARALAGDKPPVAEGYGPLVGGKKGPPGSGHPGVQLGQRFRAARRSFSIWEVVEIISHPGQPVPDVRLVRVGWPKTFKTVSLSILMDRRFYEPA
jgi:hypothetical protein